MEELIGYSCITIGIIIILGVIILSKQQIVWPIFRATLCLAIPILLLWISFYMGSSVAESFLLDQPYQLLFLGTLTILTFRFNDFKMKQLLLFSVFLIGFMITYFGLFFVLVVANMRIGF